MKWRYNNITIYTDRNYYYYVIPGLHLNSIQDAGEWTKWLSTSTRNASIYDVMQTVAKAANPVTKIINHANITVGYTKEGIT